MNHEPISQAGLPLPPQMGKGGPFLPWMVLSSPEHLPLRIAGKTLDPCIAEACHWQGRGHWMLPDGTPPPPHPQPDWFNLRKDLVGDPLAWPLPLFSILQGQRARPELSGYRKDESWMASDPSQPPRSKPAPPLTEDEGEGHRRCLSETQVRQQTATPSQPGQCLAVSPEPAAVSVLTSVTPC